MAERTRKGDAAVRGAFESVFVRPAPFQRVPLVREFGRQPLDYGSHQLIGLFYGAVGLVYKVDLDLPPSGAKVLSVSVLKQRRRLGRLGFRRRRRA